MRSSNIRAVLLLLFALSGLVVAATNAEDITFYLKYRSVALACRAGIACESKVVEKIDKGQVGPLEAHIDVSRTGAPVGTVLTAYTGPMRVAEDGTVIDSKIIGGTLRVTGANVIIKNCMITYTGSWGVDAEGAKNITIQDCDIIGPGSSGAANAAILGSGTFLRNDISKSENGIVLQDGASTVKGNYIHDLLTSAGDDGHYDNISVQGGQDGVLIEGNTLIGRDTSNIFICDDFGPVNNVTVNNNYLGGEPGFNVYSFARHTVDKGWSVKGVKITNNIVTKGGWGYFSIENSSTTVSGNVTPTGVHVDSGAGPVILIPTPDPT